MTANWAELYSELLELILKRLRIEDIIRFKAVCRLWNTAAASYISSPSCSGLPQILWLMLYQDHEPYTPRFINITENNMVYKLKNALEGFPKRWVAIGSAYGWLAICDKTMSPQLVNLLSREKIQLSSTDTTLSKFRSDPIYKLVLSSDPSRDKNFSAAVIYGNLDPLANVDHRLAFYKHGDSTAAWTWTPTENQHVYLDIICGHDGQVYALTDAHTVQIWKFHTSFPTLVIDVGHLETIEEESVVRRNIMHSSEICRLSYLVQTLSGEVLMVSRMVTVYPDGTYSTCEFVVSKLYESENESEKGCLLPHQEALLIGDRQATSVSTLEFPELQENCIYFRDAYYLEFHDLKNGQLGRFDHGDEILNGYAAVWMFPKPL